MLNGGFGFRDKFEIELNTIDDLAKKYDNYKEWLNSAKVFSSNFSSNSKFFWFFFFHRKAET